MNSDLTRHLDPTAVATIRSVIREALNNPTLLRYDMLTMALACEGVADDLRQKSATGEGTIATP